METRTPIVFGHGLTMDHEMFGRQIDALSGTYRVIAAMRCARCPGFFGMADAAAG